MKTTFLKSIAVFILTAFLSVSVLAEVFDMVPGNEGNKMKKILPMLPEYEWSYPYDLPDLNYDYDALEPSVDKTTMRIHHSKHHQGYTNGTNSALKGKEYQDKPLISLFNKMDKYSDALRNSGGGFYNHTLFWTFMTPGGSELQGDIEEAINKHFGNFETFQKEFEKAAKAQFGSGWAWLVMTPEGKLKVTNTANQDNPMMNHAPVQGIPLLNIDVWEHAYYLNYQNKRGAYIQNFWDVVDWNEVNRRYKMVHEIVK